MQNQRQRFIVGISIWFYWFSIAVYLPILPTYAKDLGAGYEMIGIILGAYGLTQMVLRLPLGVFSDRVGRRRTFLVAGAALALISALGMWLVRDVYALLFFRLLSGFAATGWVLQTVQFARCYPPAEGGKAMGLVTAVVNSGEMSAFFAGGLVAQYFGQEQTFLLATLVALPALAGNWAVRETREAPSAEPVKLADIAAMARNWAQTLPSLLGLITQVISFGTIFGFVPLVAKNLGGSYAEIGLLPTVYLLPGILASILSGTFFRRLFSERLLVTVSLIVMAAGSFVIPFVPNMLWLFVSQGVAGFCRGLVFPILLELSIRGVAGNRQATAMGYFQTIYGTGMFLGPLALGAISGWLGMDWGFWVIGLSGLVGAAMALVAVTGRRPGVGTAA